MSVRFPSLHYLSTEAQSTFRRFPGVLISSILAAIYAIYAVEAKLDLEEGKVALTLALGIPLFFALTLFRESRGLVRPRHLVAELGAGALFLGCYHFLVAGDGTNNFLLRHLHVALILHLAVSFVAFTRPGSDGEFWQFNRQIFLRLLLSTLYAAVFYVGLVVAILTIHNLFDLKLDEQIILELWFVAVFIVQTWHFLAGVPRLESLAGATAYPKGLKVFVQYLLIPLVTIYTLILYAYMAKILFTRDWPSGYIGWLVSVMSVLGIFNLLLIDPEKERSESRWIAFYSKAYYLAILPLLLMLFVAIGKRISEYGITEQRYFLTVLGVLLFGLALYFIFSREKKIKVIPISLCVVAAVTLAGPWGAYRVSLRDQMARLEKLLQKNELLKDGKIQPAKIAVSEHDQKELSSIMDYVIKNHGKRSLAPWYPESLIVDETTEARRQSADAMMSALNLKYIGRYDGNSYGAFNLSLENDETNLVDISGFERAINLSMFRGGERPYRFTFKGRQFNLDLDSKAARLNLLENSKTVLSFDLGAHVDGLKIVDGARQQKVPAEKLILERQIEGLSMRLAISRLNGDYRAGKPQVTTVNAILLMK